MRVPSIRDYPSENEMSIRFMRCAAQGHCENKGNSRISCIKY